MVIFENESQTSAEREMHTFQGLSKTEAQERIATGQATAVGRPIDRDYY